MADQQLKLTAEHEQVLATIGHSGGTRMRLAELADGHELRELESAGYVWRESVEATDAATGMTGEAIWYLTELGATAIGIDPARIYRP
jgi:hypothetical protein